VSATSVAMTPPTTERGLPVATGRETVQEVWRLSRGHRARLVAVVALGIASTATNLIPPVMIGVLVDEVQAGTAGLGTVLGITVIIGVSAVVGAGGTAVTTVLATRIYQTVLARLREQLVGRALALPQHLVERAGTGDLIARTSDDVTAVADAAPAVIGMLTVTAFTIIVSLGGLVALEWPYAAAFVVVLPVHAVALRWYLRTGPQVYRAERAAMSARAQEIVESQRGYATVLGFGLGDQRHHTVMQASWGVAVHALRARTVQSMFSARLNVAECLSLATVLITGFVLIDHGSSTVGAATTAMLLVLRLLDPINQLLFVIDTIQSAAASLNRIIGIATIPDTGTGEPATAGDTTVREVAFRYGDGPHVLHDITLDIPAGEHVAVVGASGAGKTTLAAVIAGIHRPETGTVTRPDRTAVITQEVHVFAATMRDNLTLAAPEASDRDVRAALEATSAAAMLDLLPDGLDTLVGSGGHQLTDAQAQQIALARLLLLDPELAILDEATAEAGSTHARLLDRSAEAALRGRTGLVIAHRLSQAAACDRIVVMEHGRIIEAGTHGELVAAGGVYAGLWAAWEAGRDVRTGRMNRPGSL
jgi:ABC-type multidrug transport system fused ATPase/permease subunit